MALDVEQEERLLALRDWWGRNKLWLSIVIVVALVSTSGYYFWRYKSAQESQKASLLYDSFEMSLQKDDGLAKARKEAQKLQQDYASSSYAWMAAMHLSSVAWGKKETVLTKQQLRFTVKHAPNLYRAQAAISLSSILLGEKKYSEALLLVKASDYPKPFEALMENQRGDIFLAQKKYSEAKVSYENALKKTEDNPAQKKLLRAKIASLLH